MNTSLNIVELIENNPITKLSSTYNGKLLTKIQDNFTKFEQQLFVTSFYCYLNCDEKNDFVVDLDNVWKWLGFTRKDNAKRLLEKFFTKDIDYKVEKAAPLIGGAGIESPTKSKKAAPSIGGAAFEHSKSPSRNLGGAGLNKESIMLTINTFKKFD